jgi:Flp pilus assembly protein TadD
MLLRFFIILSVFLCSLSANAASGLKDVELRDLYFGEILYYAYQDLPFDALARLDTELSQHHELDESELDPFRVHLGQAEFSVGDLELQYRMSQRAGKAIQAILGEGIDLATRNQAALQLARMFYKKEDPQSTLYALDLIREEPDRSRYEERYSLDVLRGKEPESFNTDVAYLRALASIDTGQFSEAVKILQSIKNEKTLKGYALYNLGIALIQSGKEQEGLKVLDELGKLETDNNGLLVLKDKTNLKLAYRHLDAGNTKQAKKYFQRVRLDGPYSNKALLGAGWTAVAEGHFDRALVTWSILHKRAETNNSVQESLMAVPYAYGKLQAYGKAANLYNHAMNVFAEEITSLDDSIKTIRKGKFLAALLDEKSDKDKNWVVNLRDLPDAPETRYILELMASHDFQESYKNYKDLAELRHHIDKWLADLRVYEEMIEIRRVYQEPILPVVEEKFKKIDARMKLRLEQRDNLAAKLKNMLISPRPEYLATSTERQAMDTIAALDEIITTNPQLVDEDVKRRVKRLHGILHWQVRTEYDQRLTDAYNNLVALDEIITKLKITYNSFIRTRQAATQSYEGYTIPIRQSRTRLFSAQRKLKGIMAKQGRILETMAINELDRRRKRLEEYQIKARFALAENYDRAAKAQVDEEIAQQRQLHEDQQGVNAAQPVNQDEVPVQESDVKEEPQSKAAAEDEPVKKDSSFKEKLQSR